jgi:TRAP-type mannitol/chloroaromatic compound transport system permease small subunit
VKGLLLALDAVSEGVGRAVAWLTLLTVLATFGVVVLRYAFGIGAIALQETVLYLHAAVFLGGAAFTLRHEGHVRVDILYRRFAPRLQAWVELAGTLLLLVPVCAFLLWVSWDYVAQSWSLREASRDSGGLPWVYLLKTLILAMAALLLLQGLAEALRALLFLRGELPTLKQEHPPIGEEL